MSNRDTLLLEKLAEFTDEEFAEFISKLIRFRGKGQKKLRKVQKTFKAPKLNNRWN